MVDMADICEEGGKLKAQGPRRVSPHFLPRNLGNMSSAQLSIRFGLRGPSQSQSTACTTGLHSLGKCMWYHQTGGFSPSSSVV